MSHDTTILYTLSELKLPITFRMISSWAMKIHLLHILHRHCFRLSLSLCVYIFTRILACVLFAVCLLQWFYCTPRNTRLHYTQSVIHGKWNSPNCEYYPHLQTMAQWLHLHLYVLCTVCACFAYMFSFIFICLYFNVQLVTHLQHFTISTSNWNKNQQIQPFTFDYFFSCLFWKYAARIVIFSYKYSIDKFCVFS